MNPNPASRSPLELSENQPSDYLLLGADERRALEDHFDATITTGPANTFRIRPGNVIGSLTIGDQAIVVQPKLRIDRVLFMTAYSASPHHWHKTWTTLDTRGTLTDGLAALFVSAYNRTAAQGLLRSYRTVETDQPAIRGRIRWQQQARRVRPLPIAVRYQAHDDDIPENQLLRAAVEVLRHQRLADTALRGAISQVWRQLRDLTPLTSPLDIFNRMVWTKQNAHYRPLLHLARTILSAAMVDVASGSQPVIGFKLHLYRVFEEFTRAALREALGATIVEFPNDPVQHHLYLDEQSRIPLLPDIGIRSGSSWRSVGDIKYKYDRTAGYNPDLYQVVAYALASSAPRACLIYAGGGPTTPTHHIRHSNIHVVVHHLNLDQPPDAVLQDLAHLGQSLL